MNEFVNFIILLFFLVWIIVDNVKFYNWYKKEKAKLKKWFPKSTEDSSSAIKIKVRSTNKYDYLLLPVWCVLGGFVWSGEHVSLVEYLILGTLVMFPYYRITEPYILAISSPIIEVSRASNVTISYAFVSYGLGAFIQGYL